MAKRGRPPKKKPVITLASARETHLVLLPDPLEPGKLREVNRVSKATALHHVFSRGRLKGRGDTDQDAEVRLLAGVRLQRIWERAEGIGAGAIDYSRVKVDTSFAYNGMPDAQAFAFKQLRDIRAFTGQGHYERLEAIVCEGRSFYDYSNSLYPGGANGSRRMDQYQYFRDALDRLIEYFGKAEGLAWRPIRAERV